MLKVAFYPGVFAQCHVDGTSADLENLAVSIRGRGELACDEYESADRSPITSIVIASHAKTLLLASIDLDHSCLNISGTDQALATFEANILGLSKGSIGDHQHVEWWEGNKHIERGSMPVIVGLVAGPVET